MVFEASSADPQWPKVADEVIEASDWSDDGKANREVFRHPPWQTLGTAPARP